MQGALWSTGVAVSVGTHDPEHRLQAVLSFEDDGHAAHPPGTRRGGVCGQLRCRYGLGPGQPMDVDEGIDDLLDAARKMGIQIARVAGNAPAFYVSGDTADTIEAARLAITPTALRLGWSVFEP